MSSFNDNAYTFTPGVNRLIGPTALPSAGASNYVYNNPASMGNTDIQTSAGTSPEYFYVISSARQPAEPPQNPPSVPIPARVPTNSSITMEFFIAGVGGSPAPTFSFLYGEDEYNVVTPFPAIRASPELAIYVATFTGLKQNTTYYFRSVAANELGAEISAVSEGVTTGSGGGTAPSGPPTVPEVSGTPTSTSITVTFDVAGITGIPDPTYSVLVGTTTDPQAPVAATLVTGTIYQAVVSGLAPSNTYYFKSVASNGTAPDAISAVSAGIPTAASTQPLNNLLMMTFLVNTGGVWQLNTDGNASCGTLFLTGANAGQIISGTGSGVPSQDTSIANIQAWGNVAQNWPMVSFGGATLNLVDALPDEASARNFINSFWNQFLGASGAPNPLSWNLNASVVGNFYGLDLDFEGAVVSGDVMFALVDQWNLNKVSYSSSLNYNPFLSYTPQTPNTWLNAASSQAWTNGNNNIPFPYSTAPLSSIAPSFKTSQALLAPQQLAYADFVFAQIYNQVPQYLTISPSYTVYNPVFTPQMAQWAYLVMLARRIHNASTKLIWAFSSSTEGVSTPVWTTANQAQLNDAINLINPLVSAQLVADGLAACSATEWSGGIGFWTSPTGNAAAAAAFGFGSSITRANMAGNATMLWMEAAYPSPAPGWEAAPIPILDTRAVH
jgi:hypothetical protein